MPASNQWVAHYFCVDCNKRMTLEVKNNSNGVCPFCGFNSNNKVVATHTRAAKWILNQEHWWQFWKTGGHWIYREQNYDTPLVSTVKKRKAKSR